MHRYAVLPDVGHNDGSVKVALGSDGFKDKVLSSWGGEMRLIECLYHKDLLTNLFEQKCCMGQKNGCLFPVNSIDNTKRNITDNLDIIIF